MSAHKPTGPTRRGFLERAAATVAAAPFAATAASAAARPSPAAVHPSTVDADEASRDPSISASRAAAAGYRTLDEDEAAFAEALARALCPADLHTPDGVVCGLVAQLDRELAGDCARAAASFAPVAWDYGEVCELRQTVTDREYFRAGVAAVDAVAQAHHGRRFAALAPTEALILLGAIELGEATHPRFPLVSWLSQAVHPLVQGAALADPIHLGYGNKVYWKVIGSI